MVDSFFPVVNDFPRPDWGQIWDEVDKLPQEQHESEIFKWSQLWLDKILSALPDSYRQVDSENFHLISSESEKYEKLLLGYFENALRRILQSLNGIASDEGSGKYVALVFSEPDIYYNYISYFYPEEGEFALSAGIYLNRGYGHFVFPFNEMADAEATAAHEMTHACLAHLPIPLWLNEGLAVTIEDELCGTQPLRMTNERLSEHREFWNEHTIQEFWSGQSFGRPDEGQSLSYELGRYCVRALAHDYDAFVDFANKASYEDAGDNAAVEVYGGGVGGLIEQFFGENDWSPKPEQWGESNAN